MNTKTLTFTAALIMAGCSSKFDENGRNPDGEDQNEAISDDDGANDEESDEDDESDDNAEDDEEEDIDDEEEEEEEEEPEPVDEDEDGYTAEEGDCDDEDDDIHPDADEVCDGVDNNCDNIVDNGMSWSVYYQDSDGDGYGDPAKELEYCDEPEGYVANDLDCDDTNADIHPYAEDTMGDEIDNDCDGNIDERFDTEELDAEGDVGSPSNVQVSSTGQIHVVFHDADSGAILYKNMNPTGRWSETIEIGRDGINGEYIDAIVDSSGDLHIGYTEANEYTRGLMYTTRSSAGTWTDPEVIDGFEPGEMDVGQYVSIDLDSWGLPSFGYYHADKGEPMVADMTLLGITMVISADNNYMADVLGEGAGYTGLYTAIGIDSENNDHIVYYDPYAMAGTSPEIQYSQFNLELDEIRFSETVDNQGEHISMAIRNDDVPCIAFQTTAERDLRYGCLVDGSWALEDIDRTGNVGAYTSLAFNDRGEAYIAYYDESSTSLKLAIENKDVGWNIMEVDNDGDVGRNASLAVGPDGRAHMTYYSASESTLRYAVGR